MRSTLVRTIFSPVLQIRTYLLYPLINNFLHALLLSFFIRTPLCTRQATQADYFLAVHSEPRIKNYPW